MSERSASSYRRAKPTCDWCGEELSKGSFPRIHFKCYSTVYNYARRFQEFKEILLMPDVVEVKMP